MVRTPTVFSGFDYTKHQTQQPVKSSSYSPQRSVQHKFDNLKSHYDLHKLVDNVGNRYLGFRSTDKVNSISLSLETARSIIPIPHPLRIVDTDNRRLMISNIAQHKRWGRLKNPNLTDEKRRGGFGRQYLKGDDEFAAPWLTSSTMIGDFGQGKIKGTAQEKEEKSGMNWGMAYL